MPSDDDASTAQRVARILNAARSSALSAARPGLDADPEPADVWPATWPPGSDEAPVGPASVGESGRTAIGFGSGPRWAVPTLAAVGFGGLALLIVTVLLVLQLTGGSSGQVVPAGQPVALAGAMVSPSAATVTEPMAGATPTELPAGSAAMPSGTALPSPGALRVYMVGQVRRPGVVSLPVGARVEDAIDAAGGATARADLTVMNLARQVVDGERILVPRPGQQVPTDDPAPPAGAASGTGAGATAAPGSPVDLNTATVADLDALPGVGPVIAGRIVAWRQQNGSFKTVDDLGEVSGIGDATLARLRPLVRV